MNMQALVLGCGEAFDERLPNTSFLVRSGELTVLLDCGYSVPPQVFRNVAANQVDAIYISHAHADHYFGLPAVLGRWWEEGRTKPLSIVSQQPVIDQIKDVLEYGYRTLPSRFKFPIEYRTARAGETIALLGSEFSFAPTNHSVSNYAVRIHAGGRTLCYSGDGMYTDQSAALFAGANLVLHEGFSFDPSPVHADIGALLRMAKIQGIGKLAVVHIQRTQRESVKTSGIDALVPEPGDVLTV